MGALKSDFSWKTRVLPFCGKILVEKYIRPNRPWNLLSKHFRDQTNSKLWWRAEFAIYIEIFQKQCCAADLHIQKFENPLLGDFDGDFSQNTRFSRFCGKILVERYIQPSRFWNLFFKYFGDQTNAKLCWRAESAIFIEIFQKQGCAAHLNL